jgi:hypothetical protein
MVRFTNNDNPPVDKEKHLEMNESNLFRTLYDYA